MSKFELLVGRFDGIEKSLVETSKNVLNVLTEIEKVSHLRENTRSVLDYHSVFLFSSRGSIPFLRALEYIDRNFLKNEMTFTSVPHIFSLESLLSIVSNEDNLSYNVYKPTFDRFYQDISDKLKRKILRFHRIGDKRLVVSDWDEVITGRNLSERIKVYRKMNLNENIPFNIVSFISNGKRNLDRKSVFQFKREFKKCPENYKTLDIILNSPISWSDNDEFYNALGLEYPPIMAPDTDFIYNTIKQRAHPEFYFTYFNNFNRLMASKCGFNGKNMTYRLIGMGSQYFPLFDNKEILDCSLEAFNIALRQVNNFDGIKDRSILNKEYIVKDGNVFFLGYRGKSRELSGKKAPVVLRGLNPHTLEYYKNPFVLVYNPASSESKIINHCMDKYFSSIISLDAQNTNLSSVQQSLPF